MSKCDLRIRFDREDANYGAGELVTGKVLVDVDAKVRCKALTITPTWRTHGKGNVVSGKRDVQILFEGEWSAGTQVAYPFEFRIPDGPFSYHGKLFNLDWYLEARADIPWAIDPKAKSQFFLAGAQGRTFDMRRAPKFGKPTGRPLKTYLQFAASGIAVAASIYHFLEFRVLLRDPVFQLAMAAVLIYGAYRVVHQLLSRVALSRLDVALERRSSDKLRVEVRYANRIAHHSLTTALVIEETVISGHGTHQQTLTECTARIYDHDTTNRDGVQIVNLELPNPDDVGWPVELEDNELHWFVEVNFDIPNWPDVVRRIPLELFSADANTESPYRRNL